LAKPCAFLNSDASKAFAAAVLFFSFFSANFFYSNADAPPFY